MYYTLEGIVIAFHWLKQKYAFHLHVTKVVQDILGFRERVLLIILIDRKRGGKAVYKILDNKKSDWKNNFFVFLFWTVKHLWKSLGGALCAPPPPEVGTTLCELLLRILKFYIFCVIIFELLLFLRCTDLPFGQVKILSQKSYASCCMISFEPNIKIYQYFCTVLKIFIKGLLHLCLLILCFMDWTWTLRNVYFLSNSTITLISEFLCSGLNIQSFVPEMWCESFVGI